MNENRRVIVVGVAIRIALVYFFNGGYPSSHFYPFLNSVSNNADPWSRWLDSAGRPDAFPYGLSLFLPVWIIEKIDSYANLFLTQIPRHFLWSIFVIFLDISIYRKLRNLNNTQASKAYFFSPVVLYVNFIYFQTDVIIGVLLLISVLNFMSNRNYRAGIALGAAIGSKFGVLLCIPFLIVFLFGNKRYRSNLQVLLTWASLIGAVSYLPALWSPGFRTMVLGTKESGRIFDLSISLGSMNFFIFPAIYLLLIYFSWRLRRSSASALVGFIGISLFALGIMTNLAIGWNLWALPILLLMSQRVNRDLLALLFVVQVILIYRDLSLGNLSKIGIEITLTNEIINNLVFTISIVLGILYAISIFRKELYEKDYLQLTDKPLSLVIAGDSGVGKDTLEKSICAIFGSQNTVVIQGDSYHRFERGDNHWGGTTHLHPNSNNLEAWARDLRSAIERKKFVTSEYDHSNGRFKSRLVGHTGDLVISQGLHAIHASNMIDIDLRIFIEMDEHLRVEFKTNRDERERNQNRSNLLKLIKARRKDGDRFVKPQRDRADLVLNLSNSTSHELAINMIKIEFKSQDFARLIYRKLSAFIKFVEISPIKDEKCEIMISQVNLVSSEVIHSFLKYSLENYHDLVTRKASFSDGSSGLLAAIVLIYLEIQRKNRKR